MPHRNPPALEPVARGSESRAWGDRSVAPRGSGRLPPGALLAALCTAVGLACAVRSLALALSLSTPVPIADQWEFIFDLVHLGEGKYSLLEMFSQHNEHRIFTARLNFFLDYYVFHLGNLSVVLTNYLLLAMLAGLLASLAARRGRLPGSVLGRARGRVRGRAPAFALALAVLWSVGGWLNLGWAFQIQWAYVHLLPALTLACFAQAARRTGRASRAFLLAACACDALAAFSMSSGLCTVVPVVALAVWLRASPRLVGAFVLWHAAVVALFLWGYRAPPQDLVLDPVRILRYLAPYLGTLLPGTRRGAILLGDAGLLAAAAAVSVATWTALVRRRPLDPPTAVLLGVAVFVLAEGGATAFGRAGLPDPTALALRYGTPSQVFWCAMALAAWRVWGGAGSAAARYALATAAVAAALATNFAGGSAAAWADWAASADEAGFDLVNGVWTGPEATRYYPRADLIQYRVSFLRDHQLGPFAEQEARFRAPLNAVAGLDRDGMPRCAGAAEPRELDGAGHVHVRGWAKAPGAGRSPAWLMAYGSQGQLMGYAVPRRPSAGLRAVAGPGSVPGYDAWFKLDEGEDPRSTQLVMVFAGGNVPPCLVPDP